MLGEVFMALHSDMAARRLIAKVISPACDTEIVFIRSLNGLVVVKVISQSSVIRAGNAQEFASIHFSPFVGRTFNEAL